MNIRRLTFTFWLGISSSLIPAYANDALSMSTFKRLTVIERLMGQQHYDKAAKQLQVMLDDPPKSAADKAYVYHMKGTLALHRERYATAKKYYSLSHQQNALDEKTQRYVLQTLGNLAMQQEAYNEAVGYLKQLMETPEPSEQAYLMLATAYYQLKQYNKALPLLKTAMQKFAPNKSIYLMRFSAHYALKQLTPAAQVLEHVIKHWPQEGKYWQQLAAIYLEQKRYQRSLEILQLAFAKNLLISEDQLLQFVYTLYEKQLPFKAATLLQSSLNKKQVKDSYENYRLLASLYVEARETAQALASFKSASRYASDGKEDLYIAQLQLEQEHYQEAINFAQSAIKRGIHREGDAYLLMAACSIELEKHTQAKHFLKQASRYKSTRDQSITWLNNLETLSRKES